MSNKTETFYKFTKREQAEFKKLYPITPIQEMAKLFKISVNQCYYIGRDRMKLKKVRHKKRCCDCGRDKLLTSFNRKTEAKDGRQSICRLCSGNVKKQTRAENKQTKVLKKTYVTPKWASAENKRLESQQSSCPWNCSKLDKKENMCLCNFKK